MNFVVALLTGNVLTSATLIAAALSLGLVGYGLSLVLFILPLRGAVSRRSASR